MITDNTNKTLYLRTFSKCSIVFMVAVAVCAWMSVKWQRMCVTKIFQISAKLNMCFKKIYIWNSFTVCVTKPIANPAIINPQSHHVWCWFSIAYIFILIKLYNVLFQLALKWHRQERKKRTKMYYALKPTFFFMCVVKLIHKFSIIENVKNFRLYSTYHS